MPKTKIAVLYATAILSIINALNQSSYSEAATDQEIEVIHTNLSCDSGRILDLTQEKILEVYVSPEGTVLEFPVKPQNTVFGQPKAFGDVYVKSDIILTPLSREARSNLFVYLHGRRYNIKLITRLEGGDCIVKVQDPRSELVVVEVE